MILFFLFPLTENVLKRYIKVMGSLDFLYSINYSMALGLN